MNLLLLVHGKAVVENEILESIYIFIENGKIQTIGPIQEVPSHLRTTETIEIAADQTIVPGFIDVHIHGAAGADTMDATTAALTTMAKALPAEGTTSFLATTITQKHENIEKALRNAADYKAQHNDVGQAEVIGVHLEGPFINKNRKGAQPEEYILNPDIELFARWQEIADRGIKLVTVAPELENGTEFVRYCNENGVIASIGHTDATYDQVKTAVEAGAKQVTHLFNGMRGIHHREPGTAGSALLFKELMVELIADGIHVRPEVIKLVIGSKGADGMILITDSMRAKCLKNGVYDLGGQDVMVADGKATLADGTLAGSILKMKDSFKNTIEFAQISLLEAVKMTSVNSAKQLNIYDRKGSITVGKDADLTILSNDFEVDVTICRGKMAYKRGEEI
ncbi:N-acetylglucosamine-6-phosphate deacetylase [Neobacillus massiliamazoniensis]|uniref:N-acetylglucosamine-6-phosphate deacetylase n=1 Tax=Neobacillus massiliamazoniensis TaxID=1499688 RepID=A0A0U1NTU6_9BACI|nr:N-acetylglucosamine-6-phosphate deacetylase [Neobacillus massiliamazoniensis]CRK81453.1 N-acetylglucosamine-6-phosphate deacetylase [Neobacillus massiliamazoniensis]